MSEDWLKVPISRYCDTILKTVPLGDDPARDTYRALTDPTNYAHTLDFKECGR